MPLLKLYIVPPLKLYIVPIRTEIVYCLMGVVLLPPPLPDRQVFTLPLLLNFILGLRVYIDSLRIEAVHCLTLNHPLREIDR